MKFTFKKLSAQQMIDKGIDKNIYLSTNNSISTYAITVFVTILVLGTLAIFSNNISIAFLYK